MDKKIVDFVRFLGEKSDFGGAGKDFGMEKSEVKKRFFPLKTDFSRKKPIFPGKISF